MSERDLKSKDSLDIVFAGHVDHGKSTLIGRLLYETKSLPESLIKDVEQVSKELGKEMEFAYLLDSLEEERKNNVTIDTTQIFFETPERKYTIIDVPGHKEFLRNMITGASMAESALLIVDADEGVQEQTGRHAYVLSLLGIEQAVIAVNKMDAVSYDKKRFEEVKREVVEMFRKLGIKPTSVIPISALKGDNVTRTSDKMPWAGLTLLDALNSLKGKKDLSSKPLRFPVQDVYEVEGESVIVGRVESGVLKKGDEVLILPSGKRSVVSSVRVWNAHKTSASAGESIGLILKKGSEVSRGNVLCLGKKPVVKDCFETDVFWLSRKTLKENEELKWRCTTQEARCKIKRIKRKINSSTLEELDNNGSISETEVGRLVIKTERPVVFQNFHDVESLGRFVLVKDDETLAGGVITR